MRAHRSLLGRILAAGAVIAVMTTAGPGAASARPPQQPCGEKACERTAVKE